MIIIPAIDLRDGKCVRLTQGKADAETIFSASPEDIAKQWNDCGAQRLHVVDLDGAFKGSPQNLKQFEKIRKNFKGIIEFGGGVRTHADIDALVSRGADKIIVGTKAVETDDFIESICRQFGTIFIAGIDAKNGMVAIKGWVETTTISAIKLARNLEVRGISEIIYTDIARDGMMSGPNIEALNSMMCSVSIPVIASGGIGTKQDVLNLMPLSRNGLRGAIIGKALYTGAIDLTEVIACSQNA